MKILIVDDHGLVREGLQAILERSDLKAQCLQAWNAETVGQQLKLHPDLSLVLLDIRLPDCSGWELLEGIAAAHPSLPVIMLSAEHDAATVNAALNNGASGFLPKSSLNQELLAAIRLVGAGGVYVPAQTLPDMGRVPPLPTARTLATSLESLGLTGRQIDVLYLLLQGKSNKLICRELELAEATVKIHVRGILRALSVGSRSEAIAKAVQLGLRLPVPGTEASASF